MVGAKQVEKDESEMEPGADAMNVIFALFSLAQQWCSLWMQTLLVLILSACGELFRKEGVIRCNAVLWVCTICTQGQRCHGARTPRMGENYFNFINHHLLTVASHEAEGHKTVLIMI